LCAYDSTEVVYHACEWDKNYLNEDLTRQLSHWLNQQENVNFRFIEDL